MRGEGGVDVLVRVEGGYRWGMGHVVRQAAIADALRRRGHAVGFVTTAETTADTMLRAHGFAVTTVGDENVLVPPHLPSPGTLVVDRLTQGAPLRRFAAAHPEVDIVTFDDTGAGLMVARAVINALAGTWGAYDRDGVRAALYEGPAFAPLRPAVADAVVGTSQAPVAPRARRLLLAFGGSDDLGIAVRMLEVLRHLPGPPLQLRVHRGPATRYGAAMTAAMTDHPHRIAWTEGDFVDEVVRADLVLSAGGTMLFELAALGAVTAATAGSEAEAKNIAAFASAGAVVDCGAHETLGKATVPLVARAVADARHRAALTAAGRRLVDGRGLARVVDVIAGAGA
ncbi:MAG: hypothetical protein AAF715_14085 [Myxococcota bacterium]